MMYTLYSVERIIDILRETLELLPISKYDDCRILRDRLNFLEGLGQSIPLLGVACTIIKLQAEQLQDLERRLAYLEPSNGMDE